VAAIRFYERVLALRSDQRDEYGYNVSCYHLRAAAGRGKDAQNLNAKERLAHRLQACKWLTSRSAVLSKRMTDALRKDQATLAAGGEEDRTSAQLRVSTEQELRRWKQDPDLAIIRDKDALAKLPANEQKQLREFWDSIDRQITILTIRTIPADALLSLLEDTAFPPDKTWAGILDESLEKQKPASEVIMDQGEFARLWKAWRKDEKIPDIDFSKDFVVVTLQKEQEISIGLITLDGMGGANLLLVQHSEIPANRFSYAIAVIERTGIKAFRGIPLAKPGKSP
jgi:hypothetical protein